MHVGRSTSEVMAKMSCVSHAVYISSYLLFIACSSTDTQLVNTNIWTTTSTKDNLRNTSTEDRWTNISTKGNWTTTSTEDGWTNTSTEDSWADNSTEDRWTNTSAEDSWTTTTTVSPLRSRWQRESTLNPKTSNPTDYPRYLTTLNKYHFQRDEHPYGSIRTANFYDFKAHIHPVDAHTQVILPQGMVVMVSFEYYHVNLYEQTANYANFQWVPDCPDTSAYVYLSSVDENITTFDGWVKCSEKFLSTAVYNHSLNVHFYSAARLRLYYLHYSDTSHYTSGFQMLYSFHRFLEAPQKLDSGKWNCSVPQYTSFKEHFHCNLEEECQGGEDEGAHCPFSDYGCQGNVSFREKCYSQVYVDNSIASWYSAREKCKSMGGDLPTIRNEKEWDAFREVFIQGRRKEPVFVGLEVGMKSYKYFYYKNVYRWVDNTAAYYIDTNPSKNGQLTYKYCAYYSPATSLNRPKGLRSEVRLFPCAHFNIKRFVCQFPSLSLQPPARNVLFPAQDQPVSSPHLPLVPCPSGHVTIDFLRCTFGSKCVDNSRLDKCPFYFNNTSSTNDYLGSESAALRVNSVAMFVCDNGRATIPYTLVCDFKQDCLDGSDELFCVRSETCFGFKCLNKQCIDITKLCQIDADCIDMSDEIFVDETGMVSTRCSSKYKRGFMTTYPQRARAASVISFCKNGLWSHVKPLTTVSPICPYSHFECPKGARYCLPVYLRCNGVNDCPFGEDEAYCDTFNCPGFYRCHGSLVCVLPENLCDGSPQCPQRDDELFCDLHCPDECRCQGLAYVCHRPFSVTDFPNIRYLDARGSGLSLNDLRNSFYLVWLNLAMCDIASVQQMDFPNLQYLDLSDNEIAVLYMDTLLGLRNLRVLRLRGNPLVSFASAVLDRTHLNFEHIDISRSQIKTLDTSVFAQFRNIRHLNVSHSGLTTIPEAWFQYMPALAELDIRGNPLDNFPSNFYGNLTQLRNLFVGNYKLCCRSILPDYFDGVCIAPEEELSSCEDLLRSDTYRVFLWVICMLSILGNALSYSFRLLQKNASRSAFNTFVTSLCGADFLMGVYLAIVGSADLNSRGSYVTFEETWKASTPCRAAGVLSLLSSEVSTFMICLITLDRFIVLRFPFTDIRFERGSAVVACALAWAVGTLLAVVPLLPGTSHWKFYSQNGICIPLPITRKQFSGRHYAFAVMIVLNFTLFVIIAVGQIFIYKSIKANVLITDTNKKSRDLTIARRLVSVALSDFLCWFPIGFLGVLASAGVYVSGELNVAMAVFVLPVNSALNPFLYTFNVVMEKRRKALEDNLMRILEARLKSQQKNFTSNSTVSEALQES